MSRFRTEIIGDCRLMGARLVRPPSEILCGSNLHWLAKLADDSIDAIVTDPPYGLSTEPDMVEVLRHWLAGDDYQHDAPGFMGKSWDSFVPGPAVWRECLRVLKPGGHIVAFFGSRTYDMGVLALRLAGFEIRDQIAWIYGSGFPKSHNISKAIDAAAGVDQIDTGGFKRASIQRNGAGENWEAGAFGSHPEESKRVAITAPATDAAKQWDGWGTALKPAHEPIVLARKPLAGTVAANVLAHGVGGLNIDGCRIAGDIPTSFPVRRTPNAGHVLAAGFHKTAEETAEASPLGRWPANFVHDGSPEVLAGFPETTGQLANAGSAARFFYAAKASVHDREKGLDGLAKSVGVFWQTGNGASGAPSSIEASRGARAARTNNHPTVKPVTLMRWLCRLVTPPGGCVLDPFNGSGSTGKAAMLEGFRYIGIELDPAYCTISRARIAAVAPE